MLPLVTLLVVLPTLLSSPLSFHVRWPIPLAFAAYGSLLVLFTLAYRLSPLHPLAKYPGPAIAKTSKWWTAYLGGKGDLHRYGKDLHDRYGDIVRVGWSIVFYCSSSRSVHPDHLPPKAQTRSLFVTLR